MMDSAAQRITEPPVSRLLEYRPHLKWSCFLALGAGLAFFGLAFLGLGAIAFGGALLSLAIAFFARPFAFTRVFVSNEGVNLDRLGKILEIPFSRVTAIHFRYVPYLGGWFTLKREDGRAFRFTLALERSDYILDAVAAAQPLLVSAEKIEEYRRAAIVCDHSWARVYTAWKDWPLLTGIFLIWPTLMGSAWHIWGELPLSISMSTFFVINTAVGLVIWWATEIGLMSKKDRELMDNPLNPLRDMNMEARLRRKTRILHFVVTLALFALSTTLV